MTATQELFKIDRQSKLPLYDQIAQNLRQLILDGKLHSGDVLPSEVELAEFYNVSRLTLRRALDNLVRENWLTRRHGVGTFIGKPAIASIATSKLSFTEQMRAIGREPSSRVISCQVVPASTKVAKLLNLSEGEAVIKLTRVRLADGSPLLIETAYLSHKRFEGLEDKLNSPYVSLYDTLERIYQIRIVLVDQTFKPVLLTESEAHFLETEPGSPSILSEILSFNENNQAVVFTTSVCNGDQSEFYFRFKMGETLP
ncbi:MAG: GntR family transcriptional regulator [Chloroflexota bacterium]